MSESNRIKEHRDHRGLSADEVARRCGWHAHKLLKMERGERILMASDLKAIGLALDVEPHELLNDPSDMGWQDISTAPRDGTWFLARGDFGRHAGDYEVLRFAGENGKAGQYGPFIWATPGNEVSVWAEQVPTHWHPLPVPPESTPNGVGGRA